MRTYVGYSHDVNERFASHNSGRVKATKYRRPLKILFTEEFETEQEAKKRELWWKSSVGRRNLKKYFKKLSR
jgi:putative endonuclease